MGDQNTLSAITALAYDCRRSEYFTEQLYATLKLLDRGLLESLESILLYGVDGDGGGSINLNTKTDALASTANLLKEHGWIRGEGYQPGEPNFSAIQGCMPPASIRALSP